MKTTTLALCASLCLVAARPSAAQNLIINPGFESGSANMGLPPTTFGEWRGDLTSYVTPTGGITPVEGSRMLQFLATNAGGPAGTTNTSQYFQNVDLSTYSFSSGTETISATALVNRINGNAQTDTAFGFLIDARSGTPSSSTLLSQGVATIFSDGDPGTWQSLSLSSFPVPAGTTFVRFELQAFENVANDAVDPEFDGHFADNVQLFLNQGGGGGPPPPTPPSWDLQAVTHRTYAQAVAGQSGFPIDSDDEESFSSSASVSADASQPLFTGHGEAQGSYTVNSTVLHLEGRGAGSGMVGNQGGATGYGSVQFNAEQNFSSGVWTHVVGTLTRNDTNPAGSINMGFSMGGYNQSLPSGVNGTHSFDDFVKFSTPTIQINAGLIESQPSGTGNGSNSGESTYDVTVTLLNSGTGASQLDAVLPDSGGGGQPFNFIVLPGSGRWFDPPATYGFEYEVAFGAPFTVVGLPIGIEPGGDGLYTISGDFGSVIVAEGTTHIFSSPVTSFTITGIDAVTNDEDPLAFPAYLAFLDDGFSNFNMTPLLQAEAVPEPAALLLAALGLSGLGLVAWKRRRRA